MVANRTRERSRFQGRSFTLVELLFVIAIVGLLAALLMSALRKAKDRANQMVCMENLRQIGVAGLMYVNENNGKFMLYGPVPPEYGLPYRQLAPYLKLTSSISIWWTDAWCRKQGIMWCPSQRYPRERISYMADGVTVWSYVLTSYAINMDLHDGWAGLNPRDISAYAGKEPITVFFHEWRLKQSVEGGVYFFAESWNVTTPSYFGGTYWGQFVIERPAHNLGAGASKGVNNFLFLDGHVQGIPTRSTPLDYASEFRWAP